MKLDRLLSIVMPQPAVTLPFDLISMFQAQVHTSFNFGEISSNIYEDIVFIPFFICVKFHSLIFDIWCSQGFQVIACCDLDL